MLEMLKNKSILLFIVIMLGVIFISGNTTKLEDQKVEDNYVTYNLK